MKSSIETAIRYFRSGKPILLLDSEDREGEGDFAFPAIECNASLVNQALMVARGLLCIALSPAEAVKIGITRLPTNNKDRFCTPFGNPISIADKSSGISAASRARTIKHAASPNAKPDDFITPGHVATLIASEGGLCSRVGHTEAVLDLLSLADIPGPGVLCETLNSIGEIACPSELHALSKSLDLPIVLIDDLLSAKK